MKKFTLILSVVITLAACNNTAEKATTIDSQDVITTEGSTSFTIDSTTLVTWTGFKPTGKHEGIFKVSEGFLMVKENNLTGGNFTIDVNSLSNTDLVADPESKGKLEGHLKSPDFFDVAKYPTAKFEITSVEPFVTATDSNSTKILTVGATHIIKGNLTLKDSTKNISFPAKVTIDTTTAKADAEFNIDRTQWGLNYKGPNNPQDWIITKEVTIKLSLSSSKK